MITKDQFRLQMDRLADTFGDKHFPDQREHMIWEAVRGHDYNFVIGIVDQFLARAKFAPLPGDFIDAINAEEANAEGKIYKLGDIRPKQIAKCHDCGDSGFACVVRNETPEDWALWPMGAAPCHCARGRELIEAGKRHKPNAWDFGGQYGEHWKKSYRIVPPHGYGDDPGGAA